MSQVIQKSANIIVTISLFHCYERWRYYMSVKIYIYFQNIAQVKVLQTVSFLFTVIGISL